MKIILPKENAEFNKNVEPAYYDYMSYKIALGDISNYTISQYIGKGKYSDVFVGKCINTIKSNKKSSKEHKEIKEHKEVKENKEHKEHKENKEIKETSKEHKESKEIKECKESSKDIINNKDITDILSNKPTSRIVIKVLKPVKQSKINREVLVLRNLNHKNIIPLRDVVYDKQTDTYSLIFDYIKHKDSVELLDGSTLSLSMIKHFTKQILEGIEYAHSRGIMHRDLKPQNIIIFKKHLKIIDWGLAEFYHPEQDYSVRVASRYYKGPELLVNYPYYDYSLDIWSFGCILAELIFKKAPFFCSPKNSSYSCISEIAKVLGTDDLLAYLEKFNISTAVLESSKEIHRDSSIRDSTTTNCSISTNTPIGNMNQHRIPLISLYPDADTQAVDLLEKILIYDHSMRPTASECLKHPFYQ